MSIPEIKQSLDIETVLQHYNLKPDKNEMLSCPFHTDKKASMKIYPKTNTVYCFAGSCKVSNLDVIDFILVMENKKGAGSFTKHEAILKAKSLIGTASVNKRIEHNGHTVTPNSKRTEFNRYVKSIELHQRAKDYCTARGLDWRTMEIGYKSKNTKEAWGRDCLVFPLKNRAGDVVSLYGRRVEKDGHYYQSNRTGMYPAYPPGGVKTLVLCESVIDAASLLMLNLQDIGVLALYGTNGMTSEHEGYIGGSYLDEIILALDGDDAGREATRNYAAGLHDLVPGVTISTLSLPGGEDVNSLFVSHEDKARLFENLFDNRAILQKGIKVESEKQLPKTALDTGNPNNIIYNTTVATYYIL